MATDMLNEMTMERDHAELTLGDALDVKGGIVLAVITVLGTLTGALLASNSLSNLGKTFQIGQLVSLAFLAASCLFAVFTVIPRDYFFPDLPDSYGKWIAELKEFYRESPAEVENQTAVGIARAATERIEENRKTNLTKSGYLATSFVLMLCALTIDLITLFAIGVSKILS
jgi:hypothetical protein